MASFASSYETTLICSLNPSVPILTNHMCTVVVCHHPVMQIDIIFSLLRFIIFYIHTFSQFFFHSHDGDSVLGGIVIQVSRCEVFNVVFYGDCLSESLPTMAYITVGKPDLSFS